MPKKYLVVHRVPRVTADALLQIVDSYREKAIACAAEMQNERLAAILAARLDMAAVQDVNIGDEEPLEALVREVESLQSRIAEKEASSPLVDFSVDVDLIYHETYGYIMVVQTRQAPLLELWKKFVGEVAELPQEVYTDLPRAHSRTTINVVPVELLRMDGITVDVVPKLPSKEERIGAVSRCLITRERMNETDATLGEKVMRAIDIDLWLRTPEGEKALVATAARVSSMLSDTPLDIGRKYSLSGPAH